MGISSKTLTPARGHEGRGANSQGSVCTGYKLQVNGGCSAYSAWRASHSTCRCGYFVFVGGRGEQGGANVQLTINVSTLGLRQRQMIGRGWSGRLTAKLGNGFAIKLLLGRHTVPESCSNWCQRHRPIPLYKMGWDVECLARGHQWSECFTAHTKCFCRIGCQRDLVARERDWAR